MKYFNFYSNILFTKGYRRMLVTDLQRNFSELYPLDLYYLIDELNENSIESVMQKYDDESQKNISEYLSLFIDKEYGFITEGSKDNSFPPMSFRQEEPALLSNIVIELENWDVLRKVEKSVDKLLIRHLIIITEKELEIEDFNKIEDYFLESCLEGIEVYAPYHNRINQEFINELNKNLNRIYNIVFYNCEEIKLKKDNKIYRFTINFIKEKINMNSCGKVNLKYFSTNITKVIEAINHNSCLHKKISIDKNGDIRNCPAMPLTYGNIKDTTLEEALNTKGFKKYWNLTKDEIEVCKDCEFRYICTDCRAFTERTHKNKDGLDTSKPLKCGYDPYTGKWEEWSTNPLKQKAIKFYGINGITKK